MNEETTNYFLDLAQRLEQGIVDVAPQAWDMMLWTVRVTAIQSLVIGVIGIVLCLISWGQYRRYNRIMAERDQEWEDSKEIVAGMVSAITGIPGVPMFLFTWCDVWVWTALAKPELYIVHQIVEKVA